MCTDKYIIKTFSFCAANTTNQYLSALCADWFWLRGSNHLGRQGRLAFMAWVSGLFSPSGFSPLEPPFPSNLSFAATHSNFCGTPLTSFIFQEISYSLPQPFSAGGSFHLFCHTQASRVLTCQATFSRFAQNLTFKLFKSQISPPRS